VFDILFGADAGAVALRHLKTCHGFMDAISHTIDRANDSYKIEAYEWNESLVVLPDVTVQCRRGLSERARARRAGCDNYK